MWAIGDGQHRVALARNAGAPDGLTGQDQATQLRVRPLLPRRQPVDESGRFLRRAEHGIHVAAAARQRQPQHGGRQLDPDIVDQGRARKLAGERQLALTGAIVSFRSHLKIVFGWRLVPFGVRLFIPGDIKGEYPPLCRALGVEPVALGPGLPGRVNPLDTGPLGRNLPTGGKDLVERLAEIHRRRLALLANMAEIRLRRRVSPFEEQILSWALRQATGEAAGASILGTPTIPHVHARLRDPDADAVREHRVRGVEELRELSRDVTAALGGMIQGVLGGLFDAATTITPDWSAPIVSLDVSRLDSRGDDVVAAALSCLSTWGQAAIDDPRRPVTVVIRDELWRWMTLPGMARKIDSDLRLSRAQGTIQILATHRTSDFEAVGDAGSEEVAIARGLVASCQTRLLLAQDLGPLRAIREEIGLSEAEVDLVSLWGAAEIGRALWKVGSHGSYEVQLALTPTELAITATNERMRV
jgi:hypothetical protein